MNINLDFNKIGKGLAVLSLLTTVSIAAPALAKTETELSDQVDKLQKQLIAVQKQLNSMKKEKTEVQKTTVRETTKVESHAKTAEPSSGGIQNRNIKITFGGFTEAAGVYRSRNEVADIASSWNGIPLHNSPNSHQSELRGSARQSRLSILAQGSVDKDTDLTSYLETDFLGAAPTANSAESNSYTPRLRQAFASVDWKDIGVHLLGGQAWSLVTLNKSGITPRQENAPLTIDAQYVPGFNWTRNWQVRAVKDIDNTAWLGISVESPQTLFYSGPNAPTATTVTTSPGGPNFASTSNYSSDVAPDVIAKLAVEPGWGHYELFGIGRVFHDRAGGDNNTAFGGGVGAGAILPIIPKKLDFQANVLAGSGIGRYGSAQLPDVTIKPNGDLATVGAFTSLIGLVGHPDEKWDMYLYGGLEKANRTDYTNAGLGYGYGSPLYNNSGCETEGSTACVGNTKTVSQVTAGTWWKFYKGSFGTMQTGLQYSYTNRDTFSAVGGSPDTNENIVMASFRYYPF